MGSEKYPYKGIIDHLANRGFSNGTNAWTDTDHTGSCYITLLGHLTDFMKRILPQPLEIKDSFNFYQSIWIIYCIPQ